MDFTLCRLNVKFFAFLFAKEKEIRIFAVVNFGQTGFNKSDGCPLSFAFRVQRYK